MVDDRHRIAPPRPGPHHVARPRIDALLDQLTEGPLTLVSAAAGYGKTAQLASWADRAGAAWYRLAAPDADPAVLTTGLMAAIVRGGGLPPDVARLLADEVTSRDRRLLGPQASAQWRAEAEAAELAEILDRLWFAGSLPSTRRGPDTVTVVLDECESLPADSPSVALLEATCRHLGDRLRLVLAGRSVPSVRLGRLREVGPPGQLGAADLAFTVTETSRALTLVTGDDVPTALAERVRRLTAGWPIAVRLIGNALRRIPVQRWHAHLVTLAHHWDGAIEDLAEEVVRDCDPLERRLLRATAALPAFTAPVCREAGVPVTDATLAALAERGLLTTVDTPTDGSGGRDGDRDGRGDGGGEDGGAQLFRVPPIIAGAASVRAGAPGESSAARVGAVHLAAVHLAAARVLTDHGLPRLALAAVESLGDPALLVEYLIQHGAGLLAVGAAEEVASAVERVPIPSRTAPLHRLAGQARQIRGDWEVALAHFQRADPGSGPMPAATAWRMGLIHYSRGELGAALTVLRRGVACADGASSGGAGGTGDASCGADCALLWSWMAAVYWLRREHQACREAAERALELARSCADDTALAAAYTTAAMVSTMDGDAAGSAERYTLAKRAAQRASDALALIRIRNNMGSRLLEQGGYRAAVSEFDEVIRLADATGYAVFSALALHNRGEAHQGLGQLDEASADFTAALVAYRALGSRMASYPLLRLGEVHRERGDLERARAAYQQGVEAADAAGDAQGLVPALAGLARVVAADDPVAAQRLAARALAAGPGTSAVEAQLAGGWVALMAGDRLAAAERGRAALALGSSRQYLGGMAEAVELLALAAREPDLGRLEEAARLWHATANALGEARNALIRARVSGQPATAAAGRLRALGVRLDVRRHAAGPLAWLAAQRASVDVEVRTLGGFVVLRDGEPVTPDQWRSRKARDLLKVLIARRGQPITREALAATLWPDEPADRLSNRLSVALSTLRAVLDPGRRFAPSHFVRTSTADPHGAGATGSTLVYATRDSIGLGALGVDVFAFLDAAAEALSGRLSDVSRAVPARVASGAAPALAGGRDRRQAALECAEAMYTGDFLPDEPYADWAVPLREQARAAYLRVTRALGRLAADTDKAAWYLLRLLECDPYDEDAHLRLVAALQAHGRHGEARRRYRIYTERMRELEVEPVAFPAGSAQL